MVISRRLGIMVTALLLGGACLLSCEDNRTSDAAEVRFRQTYSALLSDLDADPGVAVPLLEDIDRSGEWGYSARIAVYKGLHLFGRIYSEGELIHTPDGLVYGASADRMEIVLGDRFILRGGNQNIAEYIYTALALSKTKDRKALEYALALPNSMGTLEVYYPGEEYCAGTVELVAVRIGTYYVPAVAVRLSDTGGVVLLDVTLERLAAFSDKIMEAIK